MIKRVLNNERTYVVLITIVLSFILLDYAYGSISLGVFIFVCLLNLFYYTPQFIKEYIPFILIFLLVLLSFFWTIDFQKSLLGIIQFMPFIVTPLAFMLIPRLSKEGIIRIFDYVALSNTIFALIFFVDACIRFFQSSDASVFFYHNLVHLFDLNAIYVSSFFLVSFCHLILKKKFSKINLLKLVVLFISILLLSSKIIIFLLFLISTIIFLKSKISKLNKYLILFFFIFGAIFIVQTKNFKNRISHEFDKNLIEVLKDNDFSMDFYPWSSTSIRLFQTRLFFELLKEDKFLLTGYGINAAQGKILEKHKKYKLYEGFNHYNFHNQYLQIVSELGLFAFLCLLSLFVILLKQFYKTREYLLLFVFLLFGTLFFTESYLNTQRGIIHFTVIICLLCHPVYEHINGDSNR